MHDGPEQFDLFAWSVQVGTVQPVPAGEEPVSSPAPVDVKALPTPDLLHALERLLDGTIPSTGSNRCLIDEVARRRLTEAIPTLVRICRLHAGFDRARAVPEVTAAVKALADLAAASAASDVLRLAEQGALGPTALAAALRFFAAVRHRQAARFARVCLTHEQAAVSGGACALLAELGQQDAIEQLRDLGSHADASVAAAADLARGRLGDHAVKPVLEQRLRAATADEIPAVARALIAVADSDTVVLLGRAAEQGDPPVRAVVVEALSEIDSPAALAWLLRFAADDHADVRIAAAKGLAEHDDPRALAALQRLAADADPEVRECASAIVCEFDQSD